MKHHILKGVSRASDQRMRGLGLGFKVKGATISVWGLGFRVGVLFGVYGSWFEVKTLGQGDGYYDFRYTDSKP